ncbi:MAG: GNAT family N-acetyltransferase [Actinobacteria bacterium]|nr:GNAT family N-acetyltransferase [Actinomycetota bacterium]
MGWAATWGDDAQIISTSWRPKGWACIRDFHRPSARGQGAGQRLTEATLEFFDERGCDEVMAAVEGYNTSSSNDRPAPGFIRYCAPVRKL